MNSSTMLPQATSFSLEMLVKNSMISSGVILLTGETSLHIILVVFDVQTSL